MPLIVLLLTERGRKSNRSREVLTRHLPGAQLIEVHALEEVSAQFQVSAVELIWIDRLEYGDGLEILWQLRDHGFRGPVVILHRSLEMVTRLEEQRERAGDVTLCQLDELFDRAPRILDMLGLRGAAR